MLSNPLLAVVTALVGLLVGLVVGHSWRRAEWSVRERLVRESLRGGCYIRGQIEGVPKPKDPV